MAVHPVLPDQFTQCPFPGGVYAEAPMRSVFAAAAYLALWPGLYVAAAVVCISTLAGITATLHEQFLAGGFSLCTAMAVYLLDRVKLKDAWLDPADAQAHPHRFHFLARRASWVRGWILVLLAAACSLGLAIAWWAAVLPPAACLGVLLYAARPRAVRPRLKDVFLLKSLYVAAGITGFAACTALAAATPGESPPHILRAALVRGVPLVLGSIHLFIRVFADAVLCDIDDEPADRHHGTRTLPVSLGIRRAWDLVLAIRLMQAGMLALAAMLARLSGTPRSISLACGWWSAITLLSTLALRTARPTRLRDWVDARFALEAACVMLGMAVHLHITS